MQPISIVLCTFNGARFLDEQLRSLCAQEGVEDIVVIDDGSTDDTRKILREHAARDGRIRINENETRLGVTRNFERAVSLARCPWIALSDQDDVWLPGKLARLRADWDGRSVLLHHATHKFSGAVPAALPSPAGERRKFFGSDLRRLLYRNSIVGHTTFVRADVARRLMPFPAELPHDWWIGVGSTAHGAVQYVDEYLVHYRIHGNNAYHPAGSRLLRLRAEHDLRLKMLRILEGWSDLPAFAREFVHDYRRLLLNAQSKTFSWSLWRFYLRHAAVFFGNEKNIPSPFTRFRKSLMATLGARTRAPEAR